MAEVILMPRLSDTMTEGVIAAWHKKVGDPVKKGELLAEVETDKATMELESYKDGTLLHIGSAKGGKLQVNDLLAIIGAPGEDISSLISGSASAAATAPTAATAPAPEATKNVAAKTEAAAAKTISPADMEEVVLMPRLSDTMEAGVIAAWHKKVGDAVKKGEVLAEIETDKATMELESYKNGTLLYIGAEKGEKIPVNALLCIIGEKGKVDVEAVVAAVKAGGSAPAAIATEKKPTVETAAATTVAATAEQAAASNGRVKASPLAKKLAKEKGIDISHITGSGDGGRIIKADIDHYQPAAATSAVSAVAVAPAPETKASVPVFTPIAGQEGYTDIPNSQIRNVIAKRLAESKFTAPHFYLKMEINMDNAMTARAQLNESSPVKISFNDLVVKAVAMALRQHPAVNASWMGDKIRRHHHVHIGIAVAIEDGLIVPVVRFADQKTLPQIAAESKELAGKAKNKKLQPNEFSGNTFTISNLGMMDIEEFTAIINPPDSCILAVGRIREIVVKKGDGFAVSNVMMLTLSCDHRSVDGATGAAFLQSVKKFLEQPITMLL
ncbi:MAG: pyruvate dehydrogenase complex dihydrolipoamide acetyltransferase [Chitinophagaceae bacterium]|nr:pyruvate dehydrogenase complex dihydrolipoamide acetyltransferase [Chitinophagaceae bacterium]